MRVAIRADASVDIGSGHVMRCARLAEVLIAAGHEVVFVCRPLYGDMTHYIQSLGINVIRLSSLKPFMHAKHDTDYIGWLQTSVSKDATEFVSKIVSTDIVVTDHYAIGQDWHREIKACLNCKVIAIDDLVRDHCADLIVDQTFGRQSKDYTTNGRVLAGSNYALLNSNFAVMREKSYARPSPKTPVRVLVSMGGYDKPNVTLAVLKVLVKKTGLVITVLLGPTSLHFDSVVSFCTDHHNIIHLDFVNDMAKLMINHDIAVGAPGTTSWERACLGLPSILIPLAENQTEIARELESINAAIIIDVDKIQDDLMYAVDKVISNWREFSEANLSICDGLGMYRFLMEFERLNDPQKYQLELIEASGQDVKIIYEWQTDPRTRKYSLNTVSPHWQEHQDWMHIKINNYCDYFYMVIDIASGVRVAAVRLDRISESRYLVSIFVDPAKYGKGIANCSLILLDKIHPNITIEATVLNQNKPSQRLFEKANYQRVDLEKFLRTPIGGSVICEK
jgi:UDP-2,4-diacetamido-2,4,6-trideoxy-beta-L-altropyranose hydrolase